MANIRKIEGKTGVSYKITVTQGRDSSGKQIRHFKTWKPDRPMTPRQMEKEVQRVAYDFEREIELGYQMDKRQTFGQYAQYVIALKERQGAARTTIARYKRTIREAEPFLGGRKLAEIRPQHINAFYQHLEAPRPKGTVRARVDFEKLLAERGVSKKQFAQECGAYWELIRKVCGGQGIQRENAEKIAQCLKRPCGELFEPAHEDRGLSANTIRGIHGCLSAVFRQAEKEMLIPYNPVSRATPPAAEQYEPDYFQPEELAHILEALEDEDIKHRTMLHLFIVTGCRKGEILGLKWDKVDLEAGQLRIDNCLSYLAEFGVYEGPTKTRNTRTVAVPAETVELLRKYRSWQAEQRLLAGEQWHDHGYVFSRKNGDPENPYSLGGWLNRFSQRHGLPHIHVHAFRHTAASVLISQGVDVVTVSKMLGHAKTSMTMDTYSHAIEEAKRKATECIADVLLRRKQA